MWRKSIVKTENNTAHIRNSKFNLIIISMLTALIISILMCACSYGYTYDIKGPLDIKASRYVSGIVEGESESLFEGRFNVF